MSHVIVKLYAGRSEQEKARLAHKITEAVMSVLNSNEGSVSVAIEDVQAADWEEKVYKPDIQGCADRLYKRPGYGSLA
jgi:4-oxalocrotonate tautomerase